jgi:hypothetical protein
MSINKKVALIFIIIVLLVSCSPFYREREKLSLVHTIVENPETITLWSISNMYLYTGENGSMLAGAPGRALVQGREYLVEVKIFSWIPYW